MPQDSVTYTDFINKELVQFAKYDETPALLVADSSWFSGENHMKLDSKIMLYNITKASGRLGKVPPCERSEN